MESIATTQNPGPGGDRPSSGATNGTQDQRQNPEFCQPGDFPGCELYDTDGLTPEQAAILPMLLEGMSIADIANRLRAARSTTRSNALDIYRHFGVSTQLALVVAFFATERLAWQILLDEVSQLAIVGEVG